MHCIRALALTLDPGCRIAVPPSFSLWPLAPHGSAFFFFRFFRRRMAWGDVPVDASLWMKIMRRAMSLTLSLLFCVFCGCVLWLSPVVRARPALTKTDVPCLGPATVSVEKHLVCLAFAKPFHVSQVQPVNMLFFLVYTTLQFSSKPIKMASFSVVCFVIPVYVSQIH